MESEFLARSCRDIPDLSLMSDRDFGKVFPGVLPPNQITAPTGRASAGTAHEDDYGKRESTLSVILKRLYISRDGNAGLRIWYPGKKDQACYE